MTTSPTPTAWFDDPAEVDRYLEGELDPDTQEARDADVAAGRMDVDRLERRRRELEGLAAAGARHRATLGHALPEGLESRVRFALRRDRTRAPRRWIAAAAAIVLVAVGLGVLGDRGEQAEAMPPEVIEAIAAARMSPSAPRGCDDTEHLGRLPIVQDGHLNVWRCEEEGKRTVAKLYRPEDLPAIGYAAIAAEGVERGPDLGRTDLEDMVVFDLVYGNRRHYFAVGRAWLDYVETIHPGRASCRACHNTSRVGEKNPHNIVQRSWRLRR
ncbi:MAG: hypothetical protein QNJ90_16225 [Planctomycetota bacterium]|nr:hypothetical protein [Planctomycetota bacterium]